jgi:hypothetical protein
VTDSVAIIQVSGFPKIGCTIAHCDVFLVVAAMPV